MVAHKCFPKEDLGFKIIELKKKHHIWYKYYISKNVLLFM